MERSTVHLNGVLLLLLLENLQEMLHSDWSFRLEMLHSDWSLQIDHKRN